MLICLTGTIQPPKGIKNLNIKDSNMRLKQYIENILQVILSSTLISKIVFCESSNYKNQVFDFLKELAKLYNKSFEYLTFEWNMKKVEEKGRGYGEQEILEYFLTHSELMKNETFFIKLTGRYQVVNLDDILINLKGTQNAFVRMVPREKRCSTAFFSVNTSAFEKYLFGCGNEVDDSRWPEYQLEGVYYRRLMQLKPWVFKTLPIFKAETGSGYKLKPNYLKDQLKQILNLLWFYHL